MMVKSNVLDGLSMFLGNTSTEEALFDFANYKIRSFSSLKEACWPAELKKFIEEELSKLDIKEARKFVKIFCKKEGFYE